jgi:hypothetical protein
LTRPPLGFAALAAALAISTASVTGWLWQETKPASGLEFTSTPTSAADREAWLRTEITDMDEMEGEGVTVKPKYWPRCPAWWEANLPEPTRTKCDGPRPPLLMRYDPATKTVVPMRVVDEVTGKLLDEQPRPQAVPQGMPAGSTLIGKKDGLDVWQTPKGRRFTVQ